MVSSFGMYLTGNNQFVAYITLLCAGINIGLNFWLIPVYGMVGAAINTVIAFALLDLLSNIASNKYYKIPYEYLKILKLYIIGILVFLGSFYLSDLSILLRIFLKLVLIILFPFIIILSGYFTRKELMSILGAIKKWWNPMKWKINLDMEKTSGKNSESEQ